MSFVSVLSQAQSRNTVATAVKNLPARATEKQLQILRWLLPLTLVAILLSLELFEHVMQGKMGVSEEITLLLEFFLFGMPLPILMFFALSRILQQWRLRRKDAEALQQLYNEATQAREELTRLSAERKRLLRRQVKIHEQERRRIAGELHDELGSLLTRLNTNLGLVRGKISRSYPDLQTFLDESQTLVTQTMEYAHRIYANLRPPLLDKLGLVAALRAESRQRLSAHKLQWYLHTAGDLNHLPDEVNIVVYRITQEALSNVIRHAQAKHVEISLVRPADGRCLQLTVSDDGIGLQLSAPNPNYQSLGLTGMRERIEAIGGEFRVDSSPQSGTHIRVKLPLNGVEDD